MRIFHASARSVSRHNLGFRSISSRGRFSRGVIPVRAFSSVGPSHQQLAFFDCIRPHVQEPCERSVIEFLADKEQLSAAFSRLGGPDFENYLNSRFIEAVSSYVKDDPSSMRRYLLGTLDLNALGRDFIIYCFNSGLKLDKDQTLASFDYHNALSDAAVKKELMDFSPKDEINVLGFGLDEGQYEASLSDFLVENGKAGKVNLFGFDPYAVHKEGIQFLSREELQSLDIQFDLVTARWVLHHVDSQYRWSDFSLCMSKLAFGAKALVVEHGFLGVAPPSKIEGRLYYSLNALFDIVANIGLRPTYFTRSYPELGKDFFIQYLKPDDFNRISSASFFQSAPSIYEVGPPFPNQTIFSLKS